MQPTLNPKGSWEQLSVPGNLKIDILLSGDSTGGHLAVFQDTVQPGDGPPRHIHNNQDETFFIMEGQFKFEVDGKELHGGPGDVAFVPRGLVHAFKNVGDTVGIIRYTFTPAADAEKMFRAMAEAEAKGNVPMEELIEIAAKYDHTVAGMPLD